jgi:hypothetical protein
MRSGEVDPATIHFNPVVVAALPGLSNANAVGFGAFGASARVRLVDPCDPVCRGRGGYEPPVDQHAFFADAGSSCCRLLCGVTPHRGPSIVLGAHRRGVGPVPGWFVASIGPGCVAILIHGSRAVRRSIHHRSLWLCRPSSALCLLPGISRTTATACARQAGAVETIRCSPSLLDSLIAVMTTMLRTLHRRVKPHAV